MWNDRMSLGKGPSTKPKSMYEPNVQQQFITLVNITRNTVQARARGEVATFLPGNINGDQRRRCIQFVDRSFGIKMFERRKAALKIMSLDDGKKLLALSLHYQKQGVAEAFWKALGEVRPKWAVEGELDKAMKRTALTGLRARYKKITGLDPEKEWSIEEIRSRVTDPDVVRALQPAYTSIEPVDELDQLMREIRNSKDPIYQAPSQDDDEEVASVPEQEIKPLEEVRREIDPDEAERAEIKAFLAKNKMPAGRVHDIGKLRQMRAAVIVRLAEARRESDPIPVTKAL